jgi:hypothetical protein
MDKARHPHVTRTWTLERTRMVHRPLPLRPEPRQPYVRRPPRPSPAPKSGERH